VPADLLVFESMPFSTTLCSKPRPSVLKVSACSEPLSSSGLSGIHLNLDARPHERDLFAQNGTYQIFAFMIHLQSERIWYPLVN
jgi:hypothetical protein